MSAEVTGTPGAVRRRRAFRLLMAALLVAAVAIPLGSYLTSILFQGLLRQPPTREFLSDDKLLLDVQTFGNYPTTVTSLRLRETESQRVLWEAHAGGALRISRVAFSLGQNPGSDHPVEVAEGTLEVTVPPRGVPFFLAAGVRYEVRLCGTSSRVSCVTRKFVLGK
jgi:hypothetical protein